MNSYSFVTVLLCFICLSQSGNLMSTTELKEGDIPELIQQSRQMNSLQPTRNADVDKKHVSEMLKVIEAQEDPEEFVEPITAEDELRMVADDFKAMKSFFEEKLKAGHWPSINSKEFFREFHDWLLSHLSDFSIDGRLGISLEIRYFLCTFIVLHVPSQYGFFFPKFILKFLDDDLIDNKIVQDFIISFKRFLKYVEEAKSDYLLITFTIYRNFTIGTDEKSLEWIMNIPKNVKSDPVDFLLGILLDWKFKADGYDEWKEKNKEANPNRFTLSIPENIEIYKNP